MRSIKPFIAACSVVVALVAPMPSHAAPSSVPAVVSPPGGWLTTGANTAGVAASAGYAPVVVVVTLSGQLEYTNMDVQSHNFISDATTRNAANWDPRYCEELKPVGWQPGNPLPACAVFQDWSVDTDGIGSRNITQSAPVLLQMPDGTPKLQANTPYTFFCSYHPSMKGTLIAVSG